MLRKESSNSSTKNFKSRRNFISWNLVFTPPVRILLKPWTLSFKEDTIKARVVTPLKCLEERKNLRYTKQFKYLVLHSSVRTWYTFSEVFLAWIWRDLWKKTPSETNFFFIVCIHSFMIYTDLIEYKINGNRRALLLRCFLFCSKLKPGDMTTTGQYMNYWTSSILQVQTTAHNDLRGKSGGKTPVVSVGTTRLLLMFRKVFNIFL